MATTGNTPNPPLEPAAPDAGDLVFAPAAELARRIRRRAVSAAELLDALLAQIARHNPQLNAIVALDAEAARLRAREADAALARGEDWGPLHGVPVTLKDFHLTAGLRTTWGMAALADHVPTRDSAIPTRLKAAGAIIVGKTNMDLGFPGNPLPQANNPWDLERTPGGSSTGAAAAVAAGLSPLDIGSDLGGSVLNPAHYCGIFGMRPTERRVSLAGLSGEPLPDRVRIWRILMALGPIARSVEDLRLAMQVIAGPDGNDFEVPAVPWRAVPPVALRELRIAYTPHFGAPPAQEIAAALERLVDELARSGARVAQRTPEVDITAQVRLTDELIRMLIQAANPPADAPGPQLHAYLDALDRRDRLIASWERFFDDWDVLLCPVNLMTAPRHAEQDGAALTDGVPVPPELAEATLKLSPLTGGPAIAIPLAQDSGGLPIGVMLLGRRWDDERLLAIAERLAEVTGGYRRPPGY